MATRYSIGKIAVKMWLGMVTIIKLTSIIGGCNLQNCLVHPNGLTDLTETLNLDMWSKDSQHKWNLNFE